MVTLEDAKKYLKIDTDDEDSTTEIFSYSRTKKEQSM